MRQLTPLVALMLLISACSQAPVIPQSKKEQAWNHHQQQVLGLHDWKIQGRVSLFTADEAWPGDLVWQQQSNHYDMRIIAPLGGGNLHVYSVDGGVMLEHSSDPRPHFTPNPEALIESEFGWIIPIENLRYWMTGMPSPLSSISGQLDLDGDGRLISLNQAGWQVSFMRYKKSAGYDLPVKLLMEHKDLSVKIIVRKWEI